MIHYRNDENFKFLTPDADTPAGPALPVPAPAPLPVPLKSKDDYILFSGFKK
jgi:hypothetical protein